MSISTLNNLTSSASLPTAMYASSNAVAGLNALNAARTPTSQGPEAVDNEKNPAKNDELRHQFDKFVGGTFYRQMLSEMQKTVGKPAYFHGGQAEEMFRSELNSKLADQMAESTAEQFTGPMFELFNLQRN
jgi:hypothetical protein